MLRILALVLAALTAALTALPLSRSKRWWVRIWDFPRAQVGALALVGLACWLLAARGEPTAGGDVGAHAARGWGALVTALLGAIVLFQGAHVWRYSPLAPREVQRAERPGPGHTLAIVESNVLQTNREAERLLEVTRAADADVYLFVETDPWWQARLDALERTHPHTLKCALDNTYGMLLYSRLPLEEPSVDFLVQPDIPSMHAKVRLKDGRRVWLNCVHPRPPAPGESDESLERDAELVVVGRRVAASRLPVVVMGDLNDVAWSRTTRLFQKVSRLLDPRKGRGFLATFHARWPGLRWPLDHLFHSDDFRVVEMRRLPYVGSDHFPVYVCLSHEPDAAVEQEAPVPDAADLAEAHETLVEAERDPEIAATDLTRAGAPPRP